MLRPCRTQIPPMHTISTPISVLTTFITPLNRPPM